MLYKSLCKEPKNATSKVMFNKYAELNKKLVTKKSKRVVFRLTKVREKQFKDFQNV